MTCACKYLARRDWLVLILYFNDIKYACYLSSFHWCVLNVCFHVFLGCLLHVCTICDFFLAKNNFVECFNRLSHTSHAEFMDSVTFSVAIYRLSHQSTHLDCKSIWLSLFLQKNESIQRYRHSRIESYTSLLRWYIMTVICTIGHYITHVLWNDRNTSESESFFFERSTRIIDPTNQFIMRCTEIIDLYCIKIFS